MGVREKMKVFLVICFMSITFFSQGWGGGGKHYLIETKEKGKQAPEPGQDYNDYGNEDDDVNFDQNDNNAVDAYGDDDTFWDGTHDGDAYDEENNGEEIDVESMIIESEDSNLVKTFEEMP